MKKVLAGIGATLLVCTVSLDAAVYKGQKEYVKKCRKCHGGGQALANKHTQSEWKRMMKKKGESLAQLHLKNDEAKKSWDYFEESRFKKKARHLKDFLVEYASDSGNVPACN